MTESSGIVVPLDSLRRRSASRAARVLLIGPYDPYKGEYTFCAPPLGVWRLAGVLGAAGVHAEVFDPNCCGGAPEEELTNILKRWSWDLVGISTTGMTLSHDLALAHLTKRVRPHVCLVAGGMEATFSPELLLELAPFDVVVLGEGEEPLREIIARLHARASLEGICGTAWRDGDGTVRRVLGSALSREDLQRAIHLTPYEKMPYERYWHQLESGYEIGALPMKAEREARLAEIRSVRLITLNYCPMRCTFCSSTNFLNEAQGTTARVARLDANECLSMLFRIVEAQPKVRTIIFQDDIFVFRQDDRVLPLCAAIVHAKATGKLPSDLQFISTNRIDAMTPERLAAMKRAGFRVLGFGVESFSPSILQEFNKAQILPFIEPVLTEALRIGITPFLDMILTSPRCGLADLAQNVNQAFRWMEAGCEVGCYPYVIPFSGAAMARDESLRPATVFNRRQIANTTIAWDQPSKILPIDAEVREAILEIESAYDALLTVASQAVWHLPSRLRSLLWILSAVPALQRRGCEMEPYAAVGEAIARRLPELPSRMTLVNALKIIGRRRAG